MFCAIVAGRAPAAIVWEDPDSVAFLDSRPAAVGHTLVVPRRHVAHLWEADVETVTAAAAAVHEVATLLRARLAPDGLTLRQNTGAASGQDVFHLHVHLVPRWAGDGHVGWPRRPEPPPDPAEVLRRLGRTAD